MTFSFLRHLVAPGMLIEGLMLHKLSQFSRTRAHLHTPQNLSVRVKTGEIYRWNWRTLWLWDPMSLVFFP